MKRIRIGNNIAITWLLYENNGEIHNLEGKELELYMACCGSKFPVVDYTVTENAIAWTFPAALQTKTGYYKLVLLERDEAKGIHSYDVREAFCLEPKNALTNIETIFSKDTTVTVKSILTYANITNIATVDTVEATDGKSTNVVITLTNGKSFTINLGAGSSGGSGDDSSSDDARGTIYLNGFPDYERSDGMYYFDYDDQYWTIPPKTGDVALYMDPSGSLWAFKLNVYDTGYGNKVVRGLMIVDDVQILNIPGIVDNLQSGNANAALSAKQGAVLKGLIDQITISGGSVNIVDNLTDGGRGSALSAEQGRVLKQLIDAIDTGSTGGGSGVQTRYSSVDASPGTPTTDASNWHTVRGSGDVWLAIRFSENNDWSEWSIIRIDDYETVYSSFKSFVFTRSNASSVSAPTGGSYSSPADVTSTDGNVWSDGIPSGAGALWMTVRTFTSDNNAHGDDAWSTPRVVSDNEYFDYEFSSVANPGDPAKTSPSATNTNPNWSNSASSSTIWMAMREVVNGAYKSGSTWAIVKIKGEDGTDGSSVAIKGSVSSTGDLPASDNTAGDGYILTTNGHLYVWDGYSWEDVGQVKGPAGEDGQTPFIHIKYSDDGTTFTANSGEDPGNYIGIYWDYTATDSSTFSDYTWKNWKGQDGFGYEYIFKLTATETAPNLPSSSPNTDDYVPTGWTDDPGGCTEELPFCWVAWRKKEDGVWSAWHGTTNNKARFFTSRGLDGASGQGQFKSIVFKRSASQPADPTGGSFASPVPTGWSDGVPAPTTVTDPDSLVNTLWMTTRIFTSDGQSPQQSVWKTPVRVNDTDDLDIEFAKKQTSDAVPDTPTNNNRHGGSGTQVWYDPLQDSSEDFTQMYWMATRQKINGVGVGYWTILRIKGEKGDEGPRSPSLVFRGEYDLAKTYYGSNTRVDVVKVTSLGKYYMAKTTAGTISANVSPSDTTKWEEFGSNFESVATDTLLAQGANIANFIFNLGKMESQTQDSGGNPMLVLDGYSGTITAKSGTIGGFSIINEESLVHHAQTQEGDLYVTVSPEEGFLYEYYDQSRDPLGYFKANYDSSNHNAIVEISTQETDRPALTVTGSHQSQYPALHVPDGNVEIEYDLSVGGHIYGNVISGVKYTQTSETMLGDITTFIIGANITLTLPASPVNGMRFTIVAANSTNCYVKSTNKTISKIADGSVTDFNANTSVDLSHGFSYQVVYANSKWYLYK